MKVLTNFAYWTGKFKGLSLEIRKSLIIFFSCRDEIHYTSGSCFSYSLCGWTMMFVGWSLVLWEPRWHTFCPKGESLCRFYNTAKAARTTRPSHKTKKLYLAKIPLEKFGYIKSVYRDLTSPKVLRRCHHNPNEVLHSKIRLKCRKSQVSWASQSHVPVLDIHRVAKRWVCDGQRSRFGTNE